MILITGATGFIGQYIVDELLSKGYELRVLVRNPAGRTLPWGDKVEISEGDMLDPLSLQKALEGIDEVIHVAAVVSFDPRRREEMKRINVTGTAYLVDACLEAGIRKLVHISSVAATGRAGKGETVDEHTPWQPGARHNYYGVTKHLAEMEVQRGVVEGLPAVILNPGVVLGPGDWSSGPPKIFNTLRKGISFYNKGVGGYVAALDVAKAVRLALESDFEKGERFILVAESLDQKTFLTQVTAAMGQKQPKWLLPRSLGILLGRGIELWSHLRGKEAFLSVEIIRSINEQTYYDGQKAVRELGLTYTPIEKVIQDTAKEFRR